MNSFLKDYLERLPLTQGMVRSISKLSEWKGREALYVERKPAVLETLRQVAEIQSVESSNRIEGITAPLPRIQALVAHKTKPRDRSEQEIAGYRDALSLIHANHAHMSFAPGVVLQLHKTILKFTPSDGGRYKSADNAIEERHPDGSKRVRFHPHPAHLTPAAMETLHQAYSREWDRGHIDPLILIPAYVFDFLCIHPFADGNGRVSRLIMLWQLYRAGYGVGRYISLEKLVEDSKESYYQSLERTNDGWHEGQHRLKPWLEYAHGLLLKGYDEFSTRVGEIENRPGAKRESVRAAIRSFGRPFTSSELRKQCPHVSVEMVRTVLAEEKKAGRVRCQGRGPKASWIAI